MRPVASFAAADAVDERLQIRRIVLGARLEIERADLALVGGVLELVDRGPHFAQRTPQFRFARPLHRDLRQRHDRRASTRIIVDTMMSSMKV